MPRHAGPKPFVTAGRLALAAVAVVCVLGALVGVARLARPADPPASSLAAPAEPVAPVAPAPDGPAQRATVVGVADAVTLDVRLPDARDVVRVRALGIQGPGSCYAGESTEFARRVLGGQAIDLVADPNDRGAQLAASSTPSTSPSTTAPTVDRFDRRLQRVVLDGGRDYAVLAAEAGIARSYSVGADPAAMPLVRNAENRARAAGRGVWGPPCLGR